MFDRIQDMPDIIRKGLSNDVQNMVRGMVNTLVIDDNIDPGLAVSRVQKVIEAAGYAWSGTAWQAVIGKKLASGIIIKSDEDRRLVFGWAQVVKDKAGKILLDRQGDFIDDTWELEKSAYDYVLNSRDGGVMHVQRGASRLVESMMFTKEKVEKMGIPHGLIPEGWWIGYYVDDDAAWEGIKKGMFTGFSVHGKGLRKEADINDDTHTTEGR